MEFLSELDLLVEERKKLGIHFTGSGIPKIIHQIWHTYSDSYPPVAGISRSRELPPALDKTGKASLWRKSWDLWDIKYSGGINVTNDDLVSKSEPQMMSLVKSEFLKGNFLHLIWNELDSRTLIKLHYPHFLKQYDSFQYAIQRCDAARYFFCHRYGGIYLDLDTFPSSLDLNQLLSSKADFIGIFYHTKAINTTTFSNAAFACREKSPFLQEMWKEMKTGYPMWAFTKHLKVMSSTGPWAFTNSIIRKYIQESDKNYSGEDPSKQPLILQLFPKNAVFLDQQAKSWCTADTYYLMELGSGWKVLLGILVVVVVIFIVMLWISSFSNRTGLRECESSRGVGSAAGLVSPNPNSGPGLVSPSPNSGPISQSSLPDVTPF